MGTIRDLGKHVGTFGDGHYEATVGEDGMVTIVTKFDSAKQTYTVTLTREEWERLLKYVESFALPTELKRLFGSTSMPPESRTAIINGWNKMDTTDRSELVNILTLEKDPMQRALIAITHCTKYLLS